VRDLVQQAHGLLRGGVDVDGRARRQAEAVQPRLQALGLPLEVLLDGLDLQGD
jgi:hypothetical protein